MSDVELVFQPGACSPPDSVIGETSISRIDALNVPEQGAQPRVLYEAEPEQ